MISTVAPLALVVGLSPLPILPAVMLLMTPRARANGRAYLASFIITLTMVVALAVWLGSLTDPGEPTDEGIGWVQVITGLAFLVMAAVKWVTRPRGGATKEKPAWMAALDSYTPRQSARLGVLLASANPKNLVMALAAGAEIAVLAEDAASTAAGVLGFVAIGSIGVAIPVLSHAVLGERATPALASGRAWLDRNSTALSIGVLLLLGILLLLKGLPIAL